MQVNAMRMTNTNNREQIKRINEMLSKPPSELERQRVNNYRIQHERKDGRLKGFF